MAVVFPVLLGALFQTANAGSVAPITRVEVRFATASATLAVREIERLRQVVTEADAKSVAVAHIGVTPATDADRRLLARSILSKRLGRAGAYDHDMMSMDDIANLFTHYRHAFKSDPRDLLPPGESGVTVTRQEEQTLMVNMARERLLEIMPVDDRALARLTQARLGTLKQAVVATGIPAQAIKEGMPGAESPPGPDGVSGWVELETRHADPR